MLRLWSCAATLLAVVAAACSPQGPTATSSPTALRTPSAGTAAVRTPRPFTPTPTPAASCPAYEAAAPEESAIAELGPIEGLSQSPVAGKGERFVLQGVLLARTCDVRANTPFNVWHIDAAGHYGPIAADGNLRCCYYGASVTTDAAGRFELHTIRPATDPEPDGELPAHMHLVLQTTNPSEPDTSIVFGDDPAITGPRGPREVVLDMERRTDADGEYWFAFVVIRI